ncbi:MAG: hypothetical protein H6624_04000 [Bdellovibrionaceae bacterium]|nr:hypothetical protein [Bdellovibrionales bacterium]MCB9083477.1 hypothetical protein [Pseudobdellovibrionaceae bacterium]
MEVSTQYWRKCSSCKKEIPYRHSYYQCNVSTCNRKRTGLVFCSVSCFERHLPGARHRDAYAIEETSPSLEQWRREVEAEEVQSQPSPPTTTGSAINSTPTRRIIPATKNSTSSPKKSSSPSDREILVVASKVKDYIRRHSDMNTSASALQALSDHVRRLCDEAIDVAREDGRKTVMDRDFRS